MRSPYGSFPGFVAVAFGCGSMRSSLFRALGSAPRLQQGLRESQHMLSVLTAAYCTRPWTQRELDLFDLSADHSDR